MVTPCVAHTNSGAVIPCRKHVYPGFTRAGG